MFKNIIAFRISPSWKPELAQIEDQMQSARFVECGPTQVVSTGWIEPRGEAHGPLIESVNGHWMVKMCTEKKIVPGSVIKRELEILLDDIEAKTGRRPGKKEARDMKDEIFLSLLPKAFTKLETTSAWIDPVAQLLIVDGSSLSKADAMVTALVKSLDGMALNLISTTTAPTAAMSQWLETGDAPFNFSVDRECQLRSTGEDKAIVTYAHHNLEIDQVKEHIQGGKVPIKLAMTWDARVSFVLTDTFLVKRLKFNDVVFESAGAKSNAADSFDADFAILSGELSRLIPDLFKALDGELQPV